MEANFAPNTPAPREIIATIIIKIPYHKIIEVSRFGIPSSIIFNMIIGCPTSQTTSTKIDKKAKNGKYLYFEK